MGKRSVKERYFKDQRLTFAKYKAYIKPPFNCPICFKLRAVHIRKKRLEGFEVINNTKKFVSGFKFRVFCQHGCFNEEFVMNSPSFQEIDAFCHAMDIVKAKESELQQQTIIS